MIFFTLLLSVAFSACDWQCEAPPADVVAQVTCVFDKPAEDCATFELAGEAFQDSFNLEAEEVCQLDLGSGEEETFDQEACEAVATGAEYSEQMCDAFVAMMAEFLDDQNQCDEIVDPNTGMTYEDYLQIIGCCPREATFGTCICPDGDLEAYATFESCEGSPTEEEDNKETCEQNDGSWETNNCGFVELFGLDEGHCSMYAVVLGESCCSGQGAKNAEDWNKLPELADGEGLMVVELYPTDDCSGDSVMFMSDKQTLDTCTENEDDDGNTYWSIYTVNADCTGFTEAMYSAEGCDAATKTGEMVMDETMCVKNMDPTAGEEVEGVFYAKLKIGAKVDACKDKEMPKIDGPKDGGDEEPKDGGDEEPKDGGDEEPKDGAEDEEDGTDAAPAGSGSFFISLLSIVSVALLNL